MYAFLLSPGMKGLRIVAISSLVLCGFLLVVLLNESINRPISNVWNTVLLLFWFGSYELQNNSHVEWWSSVCVILFQCTTTGINVQSMYYRPLPANRLPNKIVPNVAWLIAHKELHCFVLLRHFQLFHWHLLSINSILQFLNYSHDVFNFFIWYYQCSHVRFVNFCCKFSVADAAAVNPNGIKALLANGVNTFLAKNVGWVVLLD